MRCRSSDCGLGEAMTRLAAILVVVLILFGGCARKYVATPEESMERNDIDWSVTSEPDPDPEVESELP